MSPALKAVNSCRTVVSKPSRLSAEAEDGDINAGEPWLSGVAECHPCGAGVEDGGLGNCERRRSTSVVVVVVVVVVVEKSVEIDRAVSADAIARKGRLDS